MGVTQAKGEPGRKGAPERLCKLPVFRPVAVRLLTVLAQEDVDVANVTSLMNSDPAFSAEVLTLANSSLYARQNRVDTVQRAIMCLGLERTRALAATVALQGMVSSVKSKKAVQDSWQHSRATAIIAESLAPFYQIHGEQAYTSALMHDIGRLGMLAAYPEYPILLAAATGNTGDLLERERVSLSMNHCEAGLWLTRIWGLPEEFQASCSQHHEPMLGGVGDRLELVKLSCVLAEALGFKPAPELQCEPVESVVNRIPETVLPRTRLSLSKLSERLKRELELDADS